MLAETDVTGTNVAAVARKHGIARSVVYNWRSARRAQAIAAIPGAGPIEFIPIGMVGGIREDQPAASPEPVPAAAQSAVDSALPSADRGGMIEVELSKRIQTKAGDRRAPTPSACDTSFYC